MTWAILTESVLLGVALAMDALAASVALGAAGRRDFRWVRIALTAGFFGFFQFMMPLVGYLATGFAESIVQNYGKYVAGALLIGIGVKMFFDRDNAEAMKFSLPRLTTLAIATSIDALLIGVSFRCLHRGFTDILSELVIIGVVTAIISAAGCLVSRWSGKLLGNHCTVLGALVLIMLGLKVIIFG